MVCKHGRIGVVHVSTSGGMGGGSPDIKVGCFIVVFPPDCSIVSCGSGNNDSPFVFVYKLGKPKSI